VVWFWRTSEEISEGIKDEIALELKPEWLSVEDRLMEIVKSEAELNRQAHEIKNIASSIVQTVAASDKATEALEILSPVIKETVPLLREISPGLKSINAHLELLDEGQSQLQRDIGRLLTCLSGISAQLTALSR
jgi:uncharacterized phage infection (PIP) family protein YhgE